MKLSIELNNIDQTQAPIHYAIIYAFEQHIMEELPLEDHINVIERYCKLHVNLNHQIGMNLISPLQLAVSTNIPELVKALFSNPHCKPDINLKNAAGNTAVHVLVLLSIENPTINYLPVLNELLLAKPDINLENNDHLTPLQLINNESTKNEKLSETLNKIKAVLENYNSSKLSTKTPSLKRFMKGFWHSEDSLEKPKSNTGPTFSGQ